MFIFKWLLFFVLLISTPLIFAEVDHEKLGKPAQDLVTQPQWNLDIAPDGKGLPHGHGTAAEGEKIYNQQCFACHGPEGMGGSAVALTGDVGSLTDKYPEQTVNSYWPYATTLFDYIRRAMPINAPLSLSADQVYALCAYILSRDDIIKKDAELNEETLPQVKMPNRDGFIEIYPH